MATRHTTRLVERGWPEFVVAQLHLCSCAAILAIIPVKVVNMLWLEYEYSM